jgi:hypothetical protein
LINRDWLHRHELQAKLAELKAANERLRQEVEHYRES